MDITPWIITLAVLLYSAWTNHETRKFVSESESYGGKALDQMNVAYQASLAAIQASVQVGGQPTQLLNRQMDMQERQIAAEAERAKEMQTHARGLPANAHTQQLQGAIRQQSATLVDRLTAAPRPNGPAGPMINPLRMR